MQDLARLADSIAKLQSAPLGKDMFFEIKSMIESMTNHLLSEQRDEDTHKQWCDKETLKSETMETSHETKRDELVADITLLTTQITTLTQAESDNSDDIKDLVDDIEETTTTRSENMAENKATMLDAQQAQTAVAKAIAVLSDFYKGVGGMDKDEWDAGEFVQLRTARRVQDPKELKDKDTSKAARKLLREAPGGLEAGQSYSGTSGGTDVVGMLENVAADFAAMETQARTDETTQSDTFDSYLTAAKESQATLEHDNEMKASRIEAKKAKLASKSGDLVNTKANLKATVKYLTSLEPACEEGDSTYAEKKAARTAEIEALKEAGKILETAFD